MAGGWLVVVATAVPAAAHADLFEASPAPGQGLVQAPGAVVLRFSEPLDRDVSRITVTDGQGDHVTRGPTGPVEGDRQAMQRRLSLLAPGVYTVTWKTLSPLDSHTLTGSYRFAVGTSTTGNERVAASPIDSQGPLGLVGRFAAFAGLALWIGGAALRRLVGDLGLPERRRRALHLSGPVLAGIGTLIAALSTATVATGSPTNVATILLSTQSGRWHLVTIGAAVAAIWRAGRSGYLALAGLAVVADVAAGHAATTAAPWLSTAVFSSHVAAVGLWIYALAAAVAAGRLAADILRRLAPFALVAAAGAGLTGVGSAALTLNAPGELTSTGYGQAITIKAVLFGVMVTLGIGHRRQRRRVDAGDGVRRLAVGEASVGLVALAVAATLVGFPDPPRQAEAAQQRSDVATSLEILDRQDAMSLAAADGPFVVGITVTPPRPGRVTVRAHVIGLEPGDGLRDGRVILTPEGAETSQPSVGAELRACGTGCLEADVRLPNPRRWRVRLTATTNRQTIDTAIVVPLPAADGSDALASTMDATERLRTARMHETLRGAEDSEPVETDYAFAAPDAMRYQIAGGGTTIFLGTTTYHRSDPGEAFFSDTGSPPGFSWPHRYYRDFWTPAAAPRIIGHEILDGVATTIIAFVRTDLAAWFRIWVGDEDAVIRRMEMRAEGHLMDQRYTELNAPLTITPAS
ncbi:MAG: copper resistance CopC/CopD family protein [Acidimicrobiia bacterium]